MEWTLHRQLKERFADDPAAREVRLGDYRIDAMAGKTLVEIQCAPLASIRAKLAVLLKRHPRHPVLLVKPIPHRTVLVTQWPDRPEPTRRNSPSVGSWHHFFLEMVHLRGLFPHPRLTIEVMLVDLEEFRQRGEIETRRRRRRRPPKPHRVLDRRLVEVLGSKTLTTKEDLQQFLPPVLPETFSTQHLADASQIPRWLAQKMAYCLRHSGTLEMAGKSGNSILYRLACTERRVA